jgi:FtsP/CotA-like multicopper oxidase with cupredoxin domain
MRISRLLLIGIASILIAWCGVIVVRFETHAGRYVWHCHILEHEDNDMMRPYEIIRPV